MVDSEVAERLLFGKVSQLAQEEQGIEDIVIMVMGISHKDLHEYLLQKCIAEIIEFTSRFRL